MAIYETGLATNEDIPAILAMQEPNLHENGGGLSVRQTDDWFRRTMSEMPIVVARRDGVLVGYQLTTCGRASGFTIAAQPIDLT